MVGRGVATDATPPSVRKKFEEAHQRKPFLSGLKGKFTFRDRPPSAGGAAAAAGVSGAGAGAGAFHSLGGLKGGATESAGVGGGEGGGVRSECTCGGVNLRVHYSNHLF